MSVNVDVSKTNFACVINYIRLQMSNVNLKLGDACGGTVVGRCPGGACCDSVCLVGSTTSCKQTGKADGPPSVTRCAAASAAFSQRTKVCGPSVNAFCPWTRDVDLCCVKDKDRAITLSIVGTCAPCADLDHDNLWVYDANDGWS